MKIIFTGGGTAGHINPALAIANFIKQKHPDWDFIYVGNPYHMEYNLVKLAGYDFKSLEVNGFKRGINVKNFIHNIKAISLLSDANKKSKEILRDFKPDVVLGTGGYVTWPIMKEASKLGIKTVTHEQNAYPGLTTKLLAKKVDKVLLAVKEAKRYLGGNNNVEVVGNPIRSEIILNSRSEARNRLNIDNNLICILSFGGSLGAETINRSIAGLIAKTGKYNNVYHIHATGKFGVKSFPKMLKKNGVDVKSRSNIDIREYINNMDDCLVAADIVICRAGAITLSELEAAGKASILIPSPNVAENHQYHNAKVLADNNAAILIEEKNLTDEKLFGEVDLLINNNIKLFTIAQNAKKLAVTDSCEKIYNIIRSL